MTTGDGSSPLRVGNTERTAALKALDEHLEAGRLGVEEYADRTAAAANAVVAADLAALFTDLPEPHPPLPTGPETTASLPVTPPPDEVARRQGGTPASWAPRLIPLAVIATIALFLVTRQGAVFVLIPLAAGLLWVSRR